jgi:hypothetical protein
MEWTVATNHQNIPNKEGWYLTLFKSLHSDDIFPLPLYYQFAWNMPTGFDGTIEYYTAIENLPVELVSGRIF